MKAIHLTSYGSPAQNLKLVDVSEPSAPASNEVLIRVEYSPINMSDLMLAQGIYLLRPSLPAVVGGEGVGTVVAIGEKVANVKVGDRVTIPFGTYSWAEKILAPSNKLFVVPENMDPKQSSMMTINPITAVLLLSEFTKLQKGSWVAFNAGNSGVGRSLIAIAKSRGIKTVAIVRRPELVDELKLLGADVVVLDSGNMPLDVVRETENAKISLGFDAVGGAATDSLASVLAYEGQIVVFGLMSGKPGFVGPGNLFGKKLTVRAFWMFYDEFLEKHPAAAKEAASVMQSGQLKLPIDEIYPLSKLKDAVEHAQRGGKVLLDFN